MPTAVEVEYKTPSQILEKPAAAAAAHLVSPANLVGTWTNVDHATRDIVKVVIAAAGSGLTVHAYGACSPTPCDWGSVAGLAYSANVSSTASVAFTAQVKFSFAQVTLTGHLQGNNLILEAFTHFTDGSGRNDYYAVDTMQRQVRPIPTIPVGGVGGVHRPE